jgi:hypothetical protein
MRVDPVHFGRQYRFPLRVTKRYAYGDPTAFDPKKSDWTFVLVFDPVYRQPGFWDCLACREAGNEWVGEDADEHARNHQMGLDYAHIAFKQCGIVVS